MTGTDLCVNKPQEAGSRREGGGRTAAAQCGLFTYKSVPVIFEPLYIIVPRSMRVSLQSMVSDVFLDMTSCNLVEI